MIILKDRVFLSLKAIRKANRGDPALEDNHPAAASASCRRFPEWGCCFIPDAACSACASAPFSYPTTQRREYRIKLV